jgi:hypothetical protein
MMVPALSSDGVMYLRMPYADEIRTDGGWLPVPPPGYAWRIDEFDWIWRCYPIRREAQARA